ncbi:helix-turn-helix domain-containing protein [Bradyrhizobium septentrionale]|uniref:Helix-turn-helix domain-containing protein n=2 Tax=Bradyrhizobium septentrionale TaxID=1404411 RepID=A0A973W637_9BRAD|nr:helix-turn-helix domain-containing protein [Bradyrhizobium septentrionale]UGY16964.1 helix-turn-helix domain-containing protein [Bradyrhizobium septentrionale]
MQAQAAPSHEISRHPTSVLRRQPHGCGPFGMIAAPMRFTRNSEIFGEDEAAEYLYQVVSGAVRTYKILEDGRRQIGAFYLPGDIFGFEAGESHISSAEAICETHLLMVKRSAVIVRASHERELTRQLWDGMALELRRFQQHSMLLIGSAEDRVMAFLLDMSRRATKKGAIELPMSRQDVADYLGLTIETVSRTFTQLEQNGVIALPTSRRVELRDGRLSSRYVQNLG